MAKGKFKSVKEFDDKLKDFDCDWLLDGVQKLTSGMSAKVCTQDNMHKALA